MKNSDLKVVVGLGKTGLSCVRYLSAQGYPVAVTDSRLDPPELKELQENFPHVEVQLGGFNEKLLSDASELVVSPGISIKEPAIANQIKRNIPVIGDIELFARNVKRPVIAITGSNGKSTVTSLMGHLASNAGYKVKVGGNLGIPALELIDDTSDLYILELSSFQLETTHSLRCWSSVNLNISPDHMDRYAHLQEYIDAKLRIYRHCDHPVINLDDSQSYGAFKFDTPPVGFTLKEPQERMFGLRADRGEMYLAQGKKNLLPTKSVPLKGHHQYANVLAGLALGSSVGISVESMLQSVTTFKGLPHRCQWVANVNGVNWYNDSKATNVGSAQAAIFGIGPEINGKLILLAGGQGKNADFSELYGAVQKYVKTVILYGQDKQLIAEALEGSAPIVVADDLQTAVEGAAEQAKAGDVVILSPACASFDMFRNFEHRGEVFMEIVRGLAS